MHRNVTALYRSHSAAELVRQELTALGVANGDIHVIPDLDRSVGAEAAPERLDALRALDLPEDDIEEYARHVRQGAVLVSAAVAEDRVGEAEDVMRRPGEFAHMHGDEPGVRGIGDRYGDDPNQNTLAGSAMRDPEAREAVDPYTSDPLRSNAGRHDEPTHSPRADGYVDDAADRYDADSTRSDADQRERTMRQSSSGATPPIPATVLGRTD